ncbi:chemotaxis protein CheW [Litoribrevibacter euphylliae]|uniref:Chemotaxis protein CheW n=1 Tax=Litoribrevibacter euphylliae TaxID=1834034 RepID=A0ABV7HB20_9GAMM
MSNSQKSSKTKVTSKPVKPMTALQGYLDDMLTVATTTAAVQEATATQVEVTTEVVPEVVTQVEPQINAQVFEPATQARETTALEEPKPVVETLTPSFEAVIETPSVDTDVDLTETEVLEPQALKETVVDVQAPPVEQTIAQTERAVSEEGEELPYPLWAASGFECLLFYVGGIKLAVPLILLGGIHRIEKELTPLFGQPDWFLGLYTRTTMDGQQNIRVVHTSKWVMPEKQGPDVDPLNHYVISLGDSEWGLLSHQLSDSIRLTADQVKWRTSAGKRPWLAGTVIDHMCAILDVDRLVDLLSQNSNRLS